MNNKENKILMDGKEFQVPPGGTLGVLALGSVGVRAWKLAKKKYELEQIEKNEKES
jgi:hypothetical protein